MRLFGGRGRLFVKCGRRESEVDLNLCGKASARADILCVCVVKKVMVESVCVYVCCLLMKPRRFRRMRIVFVVFCVVQFLFLCGCAYAVVVVIVVVVMVDGDRCRWITLLRLLVVDHFACVC